MKIGYFSIIFILCVATGATQINAQTDSIPNAIAAKTLKEIIVTGNSARQRVMNGKFGSEKLELSKLAVAPKMFGEADIIKSITLLPGVHQEAEGAGGFEVRGGNAYQNLVTMDGMTLYNPSHLMGIFSIFNDDALGKADLHKGPIPAQFGGASSSVLETMMKPGDMENYHFSGTVGILSAKVAANGPIVKERVSFSAAVRRSYGDLFLKMIPKFRHVVMNFLDANAKARFRISNTGILDVNFFASRDNLAVGELMGMHWGNIATSANMITRKGDNWDFTTTAAFTNYSTIMSMDIMDMNQRMTQYVRNFSVNEKIRYKFSENHSVDFGIRSELLRVKSGDMTVNSCRQQEIKSGWQNAVWLGYDGNLNKRFSVSAGVRLSAFSALSGKSFHEFTALNENEPDFSAKTYVGIEPRGSVKYNITHYHNIKVGAALNTQNIHGIRDTGTTFPFDRYGLTSAGIKPEQTVLYSAGYAGMTGNEAWDWSVEGYYKDLKNVYDYKDGMEMFSRINLESIILGGKGRSYGMEFMARKNSGRLTGWISYTLSCTQTQIPGINGGKWYNASNDRRHVATIVGIYDLNDRWKLSASWSYSSGKPLTAPDAKYQIDGTSIYYYSGRNTYMTPASHRLDLSATYTRIGKRFTTIWAFGLYNAYSHLSPFIIYFEDDASKPSGTRAVQKSLFGILPSVSYTLKF